MQPPHHCVTDDLGRSSSRQSSNATGRPIFSVSKCLIFCFQSPSSYILVVQTLSLFTTFSLQVVTKFHIFSPPSPTSVSSSAGQRQNCTWKIDKYCQQLLQKYLSFYKIWNKYYFLSGLLFVILFNFKVLVQCTKLVTLHTSTIIAVVIKSSRTGPAKILSV